MKKILLVISLFLTILLFGQSPNAYKFIEPNISISYDSNLFKIGERYSNTAYEIESYDFTVKGKSNKIRIIVEAHQPSKDNFTMSDLQKSMTGRINDITKAEIEDIKVIDYDKQVRNVGEFLCLGFVGFAKPIKSFMTTIICNHISENDLTEIKCIFPYSKNLDSCYKVVSTFVNGFKSYTKAQVNFEDSTIKKQYTVTVTPSKEPIEKFQGRNFSFLGFVKINELLKHKIKEVRLNTGIGEEIFDVLPNGEIAICCNDREKGKIKKNGKLILLNSFGKSVKIPFEFVYSLN